MREKHSASETKSVVRHLPAAIETCRLQVQMRRGPNRGEEHVRPSGSTTNRAMFESILLIHKNE